MNKNFFEVKNVDFKVGGKNKVNNVSFSIKKQTCHISISDESAPSQNNAEVQN